MKIDCGTTRETRSDTNQSSPWRDITFFLYLTPKIDRTELDIVRGRIARVPCRYMPPQMLAPCEAVPLAAGVLAALVRTAVPSQLLVYSVDVTVEIGPSCERFGASRVPGADVRTLVLVPDMTTARPR